MSSGIIKFSDADLMEDEASIVSFLENAACNGEEKADAPLAFDLGLIDYKSAFNFQKKIVSIKIRYKNIPDIILLLEHPCVFTLGKRGGKENLIVTEEFLKSKKIPVVQTGRGGNITFHGPGQLVLYPIVDLEKVKKGVADFVYELEEIMIRTLADFRIKSERNEKNHGVWVKNAKIGSIGLSIKRGISFHGLAFNVNMDLEPFSWINPCGMSDISMTSMENELLNMNKFLRAENTSEEAFFTRKKIHGKLSAPVLLPDIKQVKKNLLNHFFSITGF